MDSKLIVEHEKTAIQLHQQAEQYLSQNQLEAAITACQHVLKQNPNFAPAYKTLGVALQVQGQLKSAFNYYIKALESQPDFAEVYGNLGSLYAEQQQWQDAIVAYQTALRLQPNLVGVYRNLAKVGLQLNQFDAAIQSWKNALKLDLNWKAEEDKLNLGNYFLQQKQADKAIICYNHVIQVDPNSSTAYQQLGEAYTQLEKWSEAIRNYRQALELNPQLVYSCLGLGNALAQQGQLEEAITSYQRLLEIHPSYAIAYQKLGDAYFKLQRWHEAISAFCQVIQLQPNSLWSYQHLGKLYIHTQQYDKAISASDQAIKLNPKAAWSYSNLGEAFTQQKQWQDAIVAYLKAIQFYQNSFQPGVLNTIYRNLGYAIRQQIQQSDLESVIDWLGRLTLKSQDAQPYLNLGQALVNCHQFEAAVVFYKLALQKQPNDLEIATQLDQVCREQQEFEQTLATNFQKIKQNPDCPSAYTNLGNLLTEQGHPQEAIRYHQKSLFLQGWHESQFNNYQFTQDWFSSNIPIWKEHLQDLVNAAGIHILEIGSFQGMSTCWLLDQVLTHPTAKITCIDPYFKPEFDQNIAQTRAAEKVRKIVGYSQNILGSLPTNFYDVIYIDGCHLATVALQDSLHSWRLLKIGGFMIFDDYDVNQPENPEQKAKIGIDQFLDWVQNSIQVKTEGYQLILKKQAMGLTEAEIAAHLKQISTQEQMRW